MNTIKRNWGQWLFFGMIFFFIALTAYYRKWIVVVLDLESYAPKINMMPELEKFPYRASKPVYFFKGNDLYFSQTGRFLEESIPIHKGLDGSPLLVSPNSKWFLVEHTKSLRLYSHKGRRVFELQHVGEVPANPNETTHFDPTTVQWSADSRSFFIVKRKTNEAKKSWFYRYNIPTNSLSLMATFPLSVEKVYIDRTSQVLTLHERYASITKGWWRQTLDTTNTKPTPISAAEATKSPIFASYSKRAFHGHDYLLQKAIINQPTGLYLLEKGKRTLLVNASYGFQSTKTIARLDQAYNINFLFSGYFLPGNRYYVARLKNRSQMRQMVFDSQKKKAMAQHPRIDFFFSMTSNDCPSCGILRLNRKRKHVIRQYIPTKNDKAEK